MHCSLRNLREEGGSPKSLYREIMKGNHRAEVADVRRTEGTWTQTCGKPNAVDIVITWKSSHDLQPPELPCH